MFPNECMNHVLSAFKRHRKKMGGVIGEVEDRFDLEKKGLWKKIIVRYENKPGPRIVIDLLKQLTKLEKKFRIIDRGHTGFVDDPSDFPADAGSQTERQCSNSERR